MRYADEGLRAMNGRARGMSVGWVAPTVLFQQMRDLDMNVEALNDAFVANVPETSPERLAWSAFYLNWKDYLDRRAGSTMAKLADNLYTDDIAKELQTFRGEYRGFYDRYQKLQTASGQPVPAPAMPPLADPAPPPTPPTPAPAWLPSFVPQVEVPWWVWVLGGLGIAGGGYLAVRKYREMKADADEFKRHTQRAVAAYATGGLVGRDATHVGHGPSGDCGCGGTCGGCG